MKDKFRDIITQSEFCTDLMLRLNSEIHNSGEANLGGMENHCRKQSDIIRLRRELNELQKMLNPWRKD